MPLGSGRKIDVAWSEVTKMENSSKVTCNHCGTVISSKVERIKVHLEKCMQRDTNDSYNDIPPGVGQSDVPAQPETFTGLL